MQSVYYLTCFSLYLTFPALVRRVAVNGRLVSGVQRRRLLEGRQEVRVLEADRH